jgi:Cu2+-containing amine oxidase
MSIKRWALLLPAVAAVAIMVVPAGTATRSQNPTTVAQPPGKDANNDEIIQEFPGSGEQKTAWKVRYLARPFNQAMKTRGTLMVTGAWFKTGPNEDWFPVLGEVRLSEIFVPYNNGTRIYDIGAQGNYSVLKHTQADAGANGQLLNDGYIVKEVRDTGVLWKYYKAVRRGQELVLWSTLSAGNYNYLVEYAFRCDGTVTCKLGSTGQNFGAHETIGHMHHGCWRIDLNVGDKDHNKVAVVRRSEPKVNKGKAEDIVDYLTTEGGVEWKAEEFTRLRIEATKLKNGQGKAISYELIPMRPGTGRHFANNEEFSNFDFWVTPYKFDELYYRDVPKYVKQGRNISDTDVVIWYMSPAYHLPRDEDGVFIAPNGKAQIRGVAMTTWCGIEMRPRNLFDKSPLYP